MKRLHQVSARAGLNVKDGRFSWPQRPIFISYHPDDYSIANEVKHILGDTMGVDVSYDMVPIDYKRGQRKEVESQIVRRVYRPRVAVLLVTQAYVADDTKLMEAQICHQVSRLLIPIAVPSLPRVLLQSKLPDFPFTAMLEPYGWVNTRFNLASEVGMNFHDRHWDTSIAAHIVNLSRFLRQAERRARRANARLQQSKEIQQLEQENEHLRTNLIECQEQLDASRPDGEFPSPQGNGEPEPLKLPYGSLKDLV